MTRYKGGYLVGSLATALINRLLAIALVRLAPPELEMTEIPFKDLPLYTYDYDVNYPPVAAAFKTCYRRSRCGAVRHPRVQPLNPRRIEKRDRLGQPAVREERVARKPSAVIGTSPGKIDTACCRATLSTTLNTASICQGLSADHANGPIDPWHRPTALPFPATI